MVSTITALDVQHYKSLGSVQIGDLPSVALLVGPNAAGKSNVVDALRFLRDAIVHGLDHAISSRGGIELIRQYSPTRPYHVSIRVSFSQHFDGATPVEGSYGFQIASTGGGNYRVEREEAVWHEEDRDSPRLTKLSFLRNPTGDVQVAGETFRVEVDELAIASRLRVKFYTLWSLLSRLRFSALYPNTLRSPNRPDTDRQLKETGDNWASVLKSLRQTVRGRQTIQRILEMMRQVLPTLVDVRVKSVGGYLVPQFVVKDSARGKEHPFDPVQLSDGTLRVFGILLGLYQLPPPAFLALEEPELTVNAAVLAVLADAFREVSQRTQLLVTTHSPNLVDYFEPDQIYVVHAEKGETRVSRIRGAQVEAVKARLTTLQELMTLDGLEPERVE